MADLLRDRLQSSLGAAYVLERELGGGGMSRVFVAEDVALGRRIVVKVLAPSLAEGLSAERFTREVRFAARLQHPNVVPVHAAGTGPDGLPYYTMPFIDGASLRERLSAGALPLTEAVSLLRDVARALAYAHAQGIVHRDIKPENVLLTGGAAVVADFGIAKALTAAGGGAALTQVGMAVGTPAYMAPEQAAGDDDVDHRADIYAWGLLAWETLAGRHPFADRTTALALIGAQLTQVPAQLDAVRAEVPATLAALVASCLAKEPAERPDDASALLRALDGITSAPAAALSTATPSDHGRTARTLAVLPLVNTSGDPEDEHFSDGLTEEILNALGKLAGLRVMARTSSFAFKGRQVDVRAVGEQLGARYVLEGSVRRSGARLRISAQLSDAAEGHQLWSERYDREMQDVFAVQDEITAAIREALSERLLGIGPSPAAPPPAIDPATYELFLRGRHLIERLESTERGVALLEAVSRRAPGFAPAYAELARAYVVRVFYGYMAPEDGWPLVRSLGARALAVDPGCTKAHWALAEAAFYWEWDWAGAEPHYRTALALDPNDADVLASYGVFLASTRRFDEAVRLSRQGLALDPLNPSQLVRAMICTNLARRFDETLALCDRAIERMPEFPESYRWQGLSLLPLGRVEESIAAFTIAVQLSGRNVWALYDHGLALVAAGRVAEAREIAAELDARALREPVPALALTLGPLCAEPPDPDGVFRLLDLWYEQRGFWLVMLAVDPALDWLRADSRFTGLIARVGIPVGA
jgi:serine/threonine-protein kinase